MRSSFNNRSRLSCCQPNEYCSTLSSERGLGRALMSPVPSRGTGSGPPQRQANDTPKANRRTRRQRHGPARGAAGTLENVGLHVDLARPGFREEHGTGTDRILFSCAEEKRYTVIGVRGSLPGWRATGGNGIDRSAPAQISAGVSRGIAPHHEVRRYSSAATAHRTRSSLVR